MLVEHQAVKPDLLTVFIFIEIHIVEVRAEFGIKMAVREGQADGTIGTIFDVLSRIVDIGALGKSHQKHGAAPHSRRSYGATLAQPAQALSAGEGTSSAGAEVRSTTGGHQ